LSIVSLSSCLVLVQAQSNFVLPCTINTYGSVWNGDLTFGLFQFSSTQPLSGGVSGSYLVVMTTDGQIENTRHTSSFDYWAVKNIAQNTVLFQGEQTTFTANDPEAATHIWNYALNTTVDFPNVISHHDIEYNPVNNTFLTLQDHIEQVGNNTIIFDKMEKMSSDGSILWTWDTQGNIPLSEADSFNSTAVVNGVTLIDFTHANALDWDYNNSVIYLNLRHTDTFYKINETTGNIIWACGKFGNFTLLNSQGQNVTSLWYHSHGTKQVAPDVFIMFDNDYDNVTNPNDCHSRLLEVTLNETSMTAKETWSWEAPTSYWSVFWGNAIVLPNGDIMGVFGPPTHQFQQNLPWAFTDTGAVIVEISPQGQLVRTYTFPVGWGIYRVQQTISSPVSIPEYSSSAIFTVGFLLTTVMVVALVIQFRNKRKEDGWLPAGRV
jgi:hypothetical protein